MCSLASSVRRAALAMVLAVLLALGAPALSAMANPARTDLQVQVGADTSGQVTIAGALVDASGAGIPGATVSASVAGQPMQNVTTAGDGTFSMQFQLPPNLVNGTQELQVSFGGDPSHAASSRAFALGFEAARSGAQGGATTLTMNLSATQSYPGAVLEVSGTLALASGEAVASGTITFSYRGTALAESTTVTGGDGSYSTLVEIPSGAEEGEGQLVATFAGGNGLEASSATAAVTLKAPTTASSAPATESPTPAESPSPTPEASPSPSASAAPAEAEAPSSGAGSLAIWFLVAAVLVLAAGGATLLFVLARSRRRGGEDAEPGVVEEVGLIGEPEAPTGLIQPTAAPGVAPGMVAPRPPESSAAPAGVSEAPTALLPPQGAGTAQTFAPPQPQAAPPRGLPPSWFRADDDTIVPGRDDEPSDAETTMVRPRRRDPEPG